MNIRRSTSRDAEHRYVALQRCKELHGALVFGCGSTYAEAIVDCLARIKRIKNKNV